MIADRDASDERVNVHVAGSETRPRAAIPSELAMPARFRQDTAPVLILCSIL